MWKEQFHQKEFEFSVTSVCGSPPMLHGLSHLKTLQTTENHIYEHMHFTLYFLKRVKAEEFPLLPEMKITGHIYTSVPSPFIFSFTAIKKHIINHSVM